MKYYIGRQAIFDKTYSVAGYELLYRSGDKNSVKVTDGDMATQNVLSGALDVFGISNLTEGRLAFINFTRELLLENYAYTLDPQAVVVDVPGNIYLDDQLISKLAELHTRGYTLSLKSYNANTGALKFNSIITSFDIIRMDFKENSRLQLRDMIRRIGRNGLRFLAEKVETEADFETANELNFSLFQGFYFEKPVTMNKEVYLSEIAIGQLVREFLRPEIDLDRCCRIVKDNTVLTYMFLNWTQPTNSFYRDNLDVVVKSAMAAKGEAAFVHWCCLITLKQYNVTGSRDLPTRAYLRARFVERLIELSDTEIYPHLGFMLGFFSMLDKVTGAPLPALLEDFDLEEELGELLGDGDTEYADFLRYAVVYEAMYSQISYRKAEFPYIPLAVSDAIVASEYAQLQRETDNHYAGFDARIVTPYQGTILRRMPERPEKPAAKEKKADRRRRRT